MATPKPGKMQSPVDQQAGIDKSLKMKIKRTKTGTKHEIVKSGENGDKKRGNSGPNRDKKHGEKTVTKEGNSVNRAGVDRVMPVVGGPGPPSQPSSSSLALAKDKPPSEDTPPPLCSSVSNPPPPVSLPATPTSTVSAPPIFTPGNSMPSVPNSPAPPPLVPQVPQPPVLIPPPAIPPSPSPPIVIQSNRDKDVADACIGTTIGTITEPDCLGLCEPGTSVTLEGIVWTETDGMLVVNVTWRGKTYIGTLIDCTKNDWAPPRFSDSSVTELDVRTPRRSGKRGRNTGNSAVNDLANFTETRSSMYSKLRNSNAAGAKGKRAPGTASPTPFASPKNDATPNKRKNKPEGDEQPTSKRKANPSQSSPSPLPPPELIECPEVNCSKKYRDINGLNYHTSHAHGKSAGEPAELESSSEEESNMSAEVKKDESTDAQNLIDESQEPEDKQLLRLAFGNSEIPGSPGGPFDPPTNTSSPSPPLMDTPLLNIPSQPPTLTKVLPFKVKPTSSLMEDKTPPTPPTLPTLSSPLGTPSSAKKKSKSGSPHPSPLKSPGASIQDSSGGDGVQSHAYSDISDDDAPLLESEVENKPKTNDEIKECQSPQLKPFGMYPYYGQPPYLVPSVSDKGKDNTSENNENKVQEKEKKEGEFHVQKMLSHNYFQEDYSVSGYQFNPDRGYNPSDDKKINKPEPLPDPKRISAPPLNIPNAPKLKPPDQLKSPMNDYYLFQRQPQNQEDVRQYHMFPERKDPPTKPTPSHHKSHLPSPRSKDKSDEKKDRGEDKKQQEGVKPTMETQGPPPPPTSQYAYIHPGYMQTPPYGALPYDPGHPMYRAMNPMLVSSYPNAPFLHPLPHTVPRFAPEDLSQGQSGKALDLLQHHASQYYGHPSHKIHELQERAIKSPTPKVTAISATISSPSPSVSTTVPVKSTPSTPGQVKNSQGDGKDNRSPPPQRHIHTHHHTHVGLGYPILAGQYPAPPPFGAEDSVLGRLPGSKFAPPPPVVKKE